MAVRDPYNRGLAGAWGSFALRPIEVPQPTTGIGVYKRTSLQPAPVPVQSAQAVRKATAGKQRKGTPLLAESVKPSEKPWFGPEVV